MYRWTFLLALLAVIAFGAGTDNAFAQATRTWVSGVGDDANPCSRTAPCKTFAGAISKTAAGGEIDALDPGGFGSVTITKSITIDASHTLGGVSNSGANGVIVNAGVNDVVVLRGLDFDSYGGGPGLNGVRFLAGGALHIEDSVIRDNKATVPNGMGVTFVPSTGSPRLFITNTVISGNGSSSNGGVHIEPTGSAGAVVTIANSTLFNNLVGVRAVDGQRGPEVTREAGSTRLEVTWLHSRMLEPARRPAAKALSRREVAAVEPRRLAVAASPAEKHRCKSRDAAKKPRGKRLCVHSTRCYRGRTLKLNPSGRTSPSPATRRFQWRRSRWQIRSSNSTATR